MGKNEREGENMEKEKVTRGKSGGKSYALRDIRGNETVVGENDKERRE